MLKLSKHIVDLEVQNPIKIPLFCKIYKVIGKHRMKKNIEITCMNGSSAANIGGVE